MWKTLDLLFQVSALHGIRLRLANGKWLWLTQSLNKPSTSSNPDKSFSRWNSSDIDIIPPLPDWATLKMKNTQISPLVRQPQCIVRLVQSHQQHGSAKSYQRRLLMLLAIQCTCYGCLIYCLIYFACLSLEDIRWEALDHIQVGKHSLRSVK